MWKRQFILASALVLGFPEWARSIARRYKNANSSGSFIILDTTRSSNSLLQAGRPTRNRLSDRVMTPSWGKNFPVRHRAWPVLGPTQHLLWSPDALLRGEKMPRNKTDFSPLTRANVTNNLHTYIGSGNAGLGQGSTNFPKIYEPPPNCGRPKGDMQYIPYSGSTVLERPVSFTVIWRPLFRASEMMYIFIRKGN